MLGLIWALLLISCVICDKLSLSLTSVVSRLRQDSYKCVINTIKKNASSQGQMLVLLVQYRHTLTHSSP